jgi:hypothetical protein
MHMPELASHWHLYIITIQLLLMLSWPYVAIDIQYLQLSLLQTEFGTQRFIVSFEYRQVTWMAFKSRRDTVTDIADSAG